MEGQRPPKTPGPVRPALLDRLAGGTGGGSEGGIVLVRYDDAAASAEFIDSLLHAIPPQRPVARTRALSVHSGPFQPFLGWMRSRVASLDDQALGSFMSACSIYPPQRLLLSSSLRGERPRRREEIIPDEIGYERRELLSSLVRLFRSLFASDGGVFIVEDAQNLRPSALSLLEAFARQKPENGCLLVLSCDRHGPIGPERVQARWGSALDAVEARAYLVDLGTRHPGVSIATEGGADQTLGSALDDAEESLALLAWEDAALLMECRDRDGVEATEEANDARIEFIRGEIAFQSGAYDAAIMHFQAITSLAQAAREPSILELACRRAAYSHFMRSNLDRALSLCSQARGLAEAMGDEERILQCHSLALLIDDKENRMGAAQWREAYERVIALARKLRKPNALAFWLARPDRMDPTEDKAAIEANIARSIAISRRIRNLNRLSMAYHALGLFHIMHAEYGKVEGYYLKSERITKRLGNMVHLAQIRNGFGYFAHQGGRYDVAERYFSKALRTALEADDHHEVCMALCNLGINALVCGRYDRASSFLCALPPIMRSLGMRELPYHSMTGIYGLSALCHWRSGKASRFLEAYASGESIPRARHAHARAQNYAEEILVDFLVKACYRSYHGDHRAAEGLLEAGRSFLASNRAMVGYHAPFYLLESSRILESMGMAPEAEVCLQECRKESHALGNGAYLSRLDPALPPLHGEPTIPLPETPLPSLDRIRREATISKSLSQLHRKLEELAFLNALQNGLGQAESLEALARRCMSVILASFPVDIASFSIRALGGTSAPVPLFERFPPGMDHSEAEALRAYIASLGERGSFLRNDEDGSSEAGPGMSSLVSLAIGINHGRSCHLFAATCGTEALLRESDFSVLSLAGKQIAATIERMEQAREIGEKNRLLEEKNALLFHRATRDTLTGLHNRQYLLQRLEEEEAAMRRKGAGDLSLLYLDLDNFKHYNDAFGHPAGDAILVGACSILRSAVRDSDILGRFGGDEFVIILPDSPVESAQAVAARVLEGFLDQSWVRDIAREATGVEPSISPGLELSCSIGIGHRGGPFRKEELIRDADLALYRAKKEGKRRSRVYAG